MTAHVPLEGYRRGIVRTMRSWTRRLELAYATEDTTDIRVALDALDRLSGLGRLASRAGDRAPSKRQPGTAEAAR